ncbi:D-glycero-beta-D-manno-heptose 1-phosphate adenylyltransferase [Gemmata sp. JC717]|uniref:D-glycero-beta-D-manno-heptose 1-phosphate adenylyltransferase n=1 Tax=Gemmata algarum TaxID=2975278 RepID=UPI0021BA4DD1|nr:D-glycero-beta-D-manno-heptose 1-phosphate adenylyltransferase [Gemmata algarum]MDY3555818.1 D-glycero-beta-D-manno-heptose 1-phosphate adenylyltransferase [Gemmata algarum]
MTDLTELVQNLGAPRVLVVGDVMLDRYVWGNAERISQEAPVVLLRADKREERLGGASSVATMLQALGARTSVLGVVGNDGDGFHARRILTGLGIDADAVVTDPDRPTTVKERYIGRAQAKHPQQMIRVDYESREPASDRVERQLADALAAKVREADVVLISDYDKGVCTPGLLRAAIEMAKARGVRVVADPTRGGDYRKYRGCSSMTPNRLEASLAVGFAINTRDDALRAAAHLRDTLELEAGIVTLDKDGMALAHADGRGAVYPTRPRQVYDITGAGDMVMATLGLALAAGADYGDAIRLANVAGGLEVEKIGVATVTREEILADLLHSPFRAAERVPGGAKVAALPHLLAELDGRRRNGQTVAFTNGCFDVLHAGHVQYLAEARRQADCLVVAVNSDASVRQLKGPTRPLNPVEARALVLAGLQDVDYVTIFNEQTPASVIEAVRPDVLVKGADYQKADVVGAAFVESYGGRVHLADLRAGFSTTNLIERMKAA